MNEKKILVADDEPNILRSLKLVLEEEGFSVLTATSGEEVLNKTKDERPDLLILDMNMEKMNGGEVHSMLLSDTLAENVPVIVLTAVNHGEQKLEVLEPPIFTVITKPFSPYSVVDKVIEILRAA